ncbi:tyrosine-type recombinase/integrase [Oceanibaculum sp.]|uniref:tyrosine-type recombinase/integrase n=1 Tax=Oceanibaculum sp. TaxID=1903597 RepID=UPI002585FA2E|nr:tyrosine-type recombinase/integrase [Oceanibaculum sp.]MCH2393226.1 site-specific integrase [Oceanibaculum sp.]
MPKAKLTHAACSRLPKPASGQIDYFDTGCSESLSLRVSASGGRSWCLHGRVNGKSRRYALGRFVEGAKDGEPGSLRWARQQAAQVAQAMRDGVDPVAERRAARKAAAEPEQDIVKAVLVDWLKRDQAKNRSAAEVERIMRREVVPAWGERRIADIARQDCIELIDSVADRAPVMARRLHAHLHRLFRWCVGRGVLAVNPMVNLPKPGAEKSRERALSDGELVAVWRGAERIGWPFGPAIKLLILTGARREEIGALRWREAAFDDAEIRLSGERTKNGSAHIIPLSGQALDILQAVPRVDKSEYVFTTTGKSAVSGWSRAKRLLDAAIAEEQGEALPAWRIHDLRRTVATGLQKTGARLEVTEAVLNHVSGSRAGIVGVYQTHDFGPEKRAALAVWSDHVERLLSGRKVDNVVPLWGAS